MSFSFETSTPVAKRSKCPSAHNMTQDFMNDSFDKLFPDEEETNKSQNDSFSVCQSQVARKSHPLSSSPLGPAASVNTSGSSSSPAASVNPSGSSSSPFVSAKRLISSSPIASARPSGSFSSPVASARYFSSSSSPFAKRLASSSPVASPSPFSPVRGTGYSVIERLRHNVSASPKQRGDASSIFFGLEDALRLEGQLSQSSVGPFFGLPSRTPALLKAHKGIGELYDWQRECLTLPAVRRRRNLIYSLPTSGGKTLVAEILILRELLCHLRDAIFVLPYISLVQEKVRGLAPFAVDMDFVIEECAGAKGTIPPRRRRKRHVLYVCTIEKGHALVSSLIEAGRLQREVGLVVVDELHMVGEAGGRGAVLEALLAKAAFAAPSTQLVGMSATLSNMADLRAFLRADVYERDFRPVELREFVKAGDELFEVGGADDEWRPARRLDFGYTKEMRARDPDMIAALVREVIPQNSCLVFCPTKKHCENVARMICALLPRCLRDHRAEEKQLLLKALRDEGGGNVCDILEQSFLMGVAYHHGGLTMDERRLIEEAYLSGVLCCLACTSTLAAGVNLPAKRVILRAPYVGCEFITLSRYKQMIGRAGRAGIDSSGESILMIKPTDRTGVISLLTSGMDVCRSNYVTQPELLHTLVLGLVGLGLATDLTGVRAFMQCTLAAVQSGTFDEAAVLERLTERGLLTVEGETIAVTPLGRAAFRAGVDMDTAEEFLRRLRASMDGLVLHSYLHLLFLVAPDDFLAQVPFCPEVFYQEYCSLGPQDLATAERLGVTERAVMVMASGRSGDNLLLHRFQLALALHALWRQETVWEVGRRFRVHRGAVQGLLQGAGALAASLAAFCAELDEFWAYQKLLPDFAQRLAYCVSSELLPLMELPAVKRGRARQLFVAGFRTLADVARANPRDLVERVMYLPYKTAHQVISAARMILTEKAEALRDEAEVMMEEFEKNCSVLDEVTDSCLS